MDTPIFDFVEKYVSSEPVRAHMPGHKGRYFSKNDLSGAYAYDITEIDGADALFKADGIIRRSEKNISAVFGTRDTVYSAGGSTLCIQTMLAAVCGKGRSFICARNVHHSVLNACILLDLEPLWVYPEYTAGSAVSGDITAEMIREHIEKFSDKDPACVFMTSPDYLGKIADIEGIAKVCHEYGLPLLTDNAHGAYLAFLEKNIHPIKLGADLCCDSAHKTLPVLTGGAYLHVGERLKISAEELKKYMSLFGSTSPSYLILESLDLCGRYLAENFREELKLAVERVKKLKERLGNVYEILPSEPLKLTVCALSCGMTGTELAARLREQGVETEYSDYSHTVMMFSAMNTEKDFERTASAMENIKMPRIRLKFPEFEILPPKRKISPREAFFVPKESVPAEFSAGRISAETVSVCPPCVPITVPGEIIDENTIKILKIYSISQINVIK